MPSTRDQLADLIREELLEDSLGFGSCDFGADLADAILSRFTLTPVEDEEKPVKLDPKPYARDDGWRRAPSTAVYLDGIGYSFAPRPEYSQNREDYR